MGYETKLNFGRGFAEESSCADLGPALFQCLAVSPKRAPYRTGKSELKRTVMKSSKTHILFIPQGLGKTRGLTLPGLLGRVSLGLLVFVTVAVTYLLWEYPSIEESKQEMARLEFANKEQRERLVEMAGEIVLLAEKLAESQGVTGHDQTIAVLKGNVDRTSCQEGDKEPTGITVSGLPPSVSCETMIRAMHESLDYLHAEINAVALLNGSERFEFAWKADESREQSIDVEKAARISKRTMIKSQLRTIARELGLAPRLALSMAQVESGFDHKAVSPRGAIGVLQIMPRLASEHFEVDPEMLYDPEINIRVGLLHMKYLLERFEDNIDLSLAAYNAGVRRVITAGYRVPSITETREYVRKVKAAMNDYVAVTSWEN
jgi:hypothetical protein